MANRLKMAITTSIRTLYQRGWSQRKIARDLGISRTTVRRYLGGRGLHSNCTTNPPTGSGPNSNCTTNPPTGSGPDSNGTTGSGGDSNCTTDPPAGAGGGPASLCKPFVQIIEAKLAQSLTAQRIYQDLVVEHGFTGGYDSVKRFVRRLRKSSPLPFRRMQCAPGAEAQVDFGTGAPVVLASGKRRRSHVFRVVLSHSRKGFSESVFRQTTESFIRCLEDSFWHFGGVPKTLVIDNLRAAVAKADWYEPEVHPIIRSFCEHYGTVILPAKPYMPRHKGKVERGIGYVKSNALKGRKFASLSEENRHLQDWEARVADTRIHGTTRKQVGKLFRNVERPALLPLPAGRFAFFREGQRAVHRDGHVEVARAYYSVPPEYMARRVWVRWDGRLVRVFNRRMEPIAVHAQQEPGRFSTQEKHIDSRKISGVERGAIWLLGRASLIGPHSERWSKAMLDARGIPGVRVLNGLLSLTRNCSDDQIEDACQIAMTHNAFRLRAIRELIKRGGSKQKEFEFLEQHEIIRDLSDYGDLVHRAFGGIETSKTQTQIKTLPSSSLDARAEAKHFTQETLA